jgi:hypothetical protein
MALMVHQHSGRRKGINLQKMALNLVNLKAKLDFIPISIYINVFNFGSMAEIQFNPSRVFDVEGSSLCPVTELENTIYWVILKIQGLICPIWCVDKVTGLISYSQLEWPSNWMDYVRVCRLDIAADFTVEQDTFNVNTIKQAVSNSKKVLRTTENYGECNEIDWGKQPWIRHIFYS